MAQLSIVVGLLVALGLGIRLVIPHVEHQADTDWPKVNVSRYVQGMQRLFLSDADPVRRRNMIIILRRWQVDQRLDVVSRTQVEELLRKVCKLNVDRHMVCRG